MAGAGREDRDCLAFPRLRQEDPHPPLSTLSFPFLSLACTFFLSFSLPLPSLPLSLCLPRLSHCLPFSLFPSKAPLLILFQNVTKYSIHKFELLKDAAIREVSSAYLLIRGNKVNVH